MREKDAVLRYLEASTSQYPDYSRTTAAERWDVRDAYFRQCSSHEFVSLSVSPSTLSSPSSALGSPTTSSRSWSSTDSDIPPLALKPVETSFMRLLRFIFGTGSNQVPVGPGAPRSFCLSLVFNDLSNAVTLFDELSVGIDCWEVRADCLRSADASYVAFQLALLRRHSDLPILFTTRTRSQGGNFPEISSFGGPGNSQQQQQQQQDLQRQLYDLVILAYKLGCEYVDLELGWPEHMLMSLVGKRGNTKVVGSWHDTAGRIPWTGHETREIFEKGARIGVDLIKIVNTARRSEDNIALRSFVDQMSSRGIPLIAINEGSEVRLINL